MSREPPASSIRSWVAPVLAVAGVLLSIAALTWLFLRPVPEWQPPPSSTPLEAEMLEARIEQLRWRMARLEEARSAVLEPGASPPDDEAAAPWGEEIAQLLQRMEALEAQYRDEVLRRSQTPEPDDDERDRALVDSPLGLEALAESRGLFLDRQSGVDSRIAALRMLARFPEEMDPLGGGVLEGALEMLDGTEDPRTMDKVLEALERVRDPRLLDHLHRALQGHEQAAMREEAAKFLGAHRAWPGVEQTLRRAAQEDPSEEVRRRAQRVLERWEEDG